MGRGFFVSLEGIDGAGKTTHMGSLRALLQGEGLEVVAVREPGGTPVSERIREVLLDSRNQGMSARAEAFLYAAARAQLVDEVIAPALARGCAVLADRYLDSTLAYQGYGRGLDLVFLSRLNRLAAENTLPDLTIVLDVPAEVALARRGKASLDRLEQEGAAFLERVRQGYLELSRQHPQRMVVVDAARRVEEVGREIAAIVRARLQVRRHGTH